MKKKTEFNVINSISEVHRVSGLPKPTNPLISLIHHADENPGSTLEGSQVVMNFYNITIKRNYHGKIKYGQNYYDYDEGFLSFLAPKQVLKIDNHSERSKDGWSLLFHPDLIRNYPLGQRIKHYGFFDYSANEALHLSEKEESTIEALVHNIERECQTTIDRYSQDVIVSTLELLLNYCNRFYDRQFLTRKMANDDLLTAFERVVSNHLEHNADLVLPTVGDIAEKLHVSPNYLSDMLRTITGQNAQQRIQEKLIEKAKEYLTTTSLSVGEIAYQLGFEYPQSFSKLFKAKTNVSPLAFRKSFN